jgi:4'-phosphopantetheinyl transferase
VSDLHAWVQSPADLRLAQEEIHLWRAYLDCAEPFLRRFEATLSSDERDRAKRYSFQRDRNNFIAARGVLRELLGKYLARVPQEIEFDYSLQGKPALRSRGLELPIRFNVSHSHGLALFAFALGTVTWEWMSS